MTELLYFIQDDGPIKIGITQDLVARLRGLQSGNPRQLTVLLCCETPRGVERTLHARLDRYRIRGEWFEDDDEVLKALDEIRKQYGEQECLECERLAQYAIAGLDRGRSSYRHTCGAVPASFDSPLQTERFS